MQTKVSQYTNKRVQAIVERGQFDSSYELLQYLLSVFLRYADPEGEEDGEKDVELIKEWAEMFNGWQDRSKRIITVKSGQGNELVLTDAIMIYSEIGKSGYVAKKVSFRAEQGCKGSKTIVTGNVDECINAVFRKLRPKMAADLECIGRSCGTKHVAATVEALLQDTSIPRTSEDGQGSIAFAQTEYGNVPVRKNNKRKGIDP